MPDCRRGRCGWPGWRTRSGSRRPDRAPRAPTSTRSSPKTSRPQSRGPRRYAPRSRHTPIPDGRSGCRKGSRESARAVRSSSSCHALAGFRDGFSRTELIMGGRGSNTEQVMDKRIAGVGAGAIGGYTGGHLAHNGFDVTLIDPWPEHVQTIRKDGLALEGVTTEEFVCARPRTMHLTEAQQLAKEKPIDIAMVAVKSYDTEW